MPETSNDGQRDLADIERGSLLVQGLYQLADGIKTEFVGEQMVVEQGLYSLERQELNLIITDEAIKYPIRVILIQSPDATYPTNLESLVNRVRTYVEPFKDIMSNDGIRASYRFGAKQDRWIMEFDVLI